METEQRIEALLAQMTLAEKLGQMSQVHGDVEEHKALIRRGRVGSFLNVVGARAEEFQRVALGESRLKIPLLFGRDVIHGFRTAFPIPLGQAASFDPEVAREGAAVAAREAASAGIHWTFAPMVDIARDPRWGRIAESCGEDPHLASVMGAAMIEGFQGTGAEALRAPGRVAACAKHYVGYGAAEGGRDYNTTLIPERTLRNVYLPPFAACVRAGAATLMSAFNDLNDIPASGHEFALRRVLKEEWRFDGFVVSDWTSLTEMILHGYCADAREVAVAGTRAGVDMEMVSSSYLDHGEELVADGRIRMEWIDDAVRRILRIKFRLGLFDRGPAATVPESVLLSPDHLAAARRAALESCVLLKNGGALPLRGAKRIAAIGPLADSPGDQMGCWMMDGLAAAVRTPLAALREALGADAVDFAPGVKSCRDADESLIPAAVEIAKRADAVVLFLGEDAGLSGEAHCRALLDLPGAQEKLVAAVAAAGRPVVAVILAGRPLTVDGFAPLVDALLWAWHPGTMGGPAIVDLLLGRESPSGRLPVTFPRTVGQIPLYYNRKNTGRPPKEDQRAAPTGTPLDPKDFASLYMDVDFRPEFPFGFGLTYTTFEYSPVRLSRTTLRTGETLEASVTIRNPGAVHAVAVPQLYLRDPAASATRPVRELKGFRRIEIAPGAVETVAFAIGSADLAFWNGEMEFTAEPGEFEVWIAPDSSCAGPAARFRLE